MIRLIKLFLLVNLLFILAGCPIRETIEIYNNSHNSVIIHTEKKSVRLEAHSRLIIGSKDGQLTWDDLDWIKDENKGIFSSLKIDNATGETVEYYLLFPDLPDDYVDISEGVRRIKIQLEENGKAFLIPPNHDFPILDKSLMIAL